MDTGTREHSKNTGDSEKSFFGSDYIDQDFLNIYDTVNDDLDDISQDER